MAIVGTCAYCSAPAATTCKSCGAAVCPTHADQTLGMCRRCAGNATRGKPPGAREL